MKPTVLKPQITNLIKAATGKTCTVRIDLNTCIRGVIESVEFLRWRNRGGDRICVFKLYLLGGSKKIRHCLIVEKLPWRDGCEVRGRFFE